MQNGDDIWRRRKGALDATIKDTMEMNAEDGKRLRDKVKEWEKGVSEFNKALQEGKVGKGEEEEAKNFIEAFGPDVTAMLYEHRQIQACNQLLHSLQQFADGVFDFFLEGFYGDELNLKRSKVYPPRYVLRTLLDQISIDLKIVQGAVHQRQRRAGGEMTQQAVTLYQADILSEHTIRPAIDNGFLRRYTPVITHFERNFSARLIPYDNILLIGIPYTTMAIPKNQHTRMGLSRDFLTIPHEVGHYLFWNGQIPGSDEYIDQYLERRLEENGIRTWDWRRQWLEELFADTYSCLVAGPVTVLDFQDLLTDNLPEHFREDPARHPIPILRPFIQSRIVRKIRAADGKKRFKKAPKRLNRHWRRLIKNQLVAADDKPLAASYLLRGVALPMAGKEIVRALDEMIDLILETLQVRRPRDVSPSWLPATWTPWTSDLDKDNDDVASLYEEFLGKDFPVETRWLRHEAGSELAQPPFRPQLKELTGKKVAESDWKRLFLFRGWSTEGPEADKIP